jgi:hypothetical protein
MFLPSDEIGGCDDVPIVNVSVCASPIEVLPNIFRYGYATPFYNISHAIRSIVFGTKNSRTFALVTLTLKRFTTYELVGLNFGVLSSWIFISSITMPMLQWLVRRRAVIAEGMPRHKEVAASIPVGGVEKEHGGLRHDDELDGSHCREQYVMS